MGAREHRPHRKTTARAVLSRHREPAHYAEMPHVDETTACARRWRQGPLTSRQGHAQTRCPRTRLLCPHRSRSVSHLVVLFLGLSALLTQSESSCPPGLAPNGGTCKNCPPGSFKSVEGTAPCQQCAANTFSSGERVEDLLRAIASGGGGTVLTVTAAEFGSTVSGLAFLHDSGTLFVADKDRHQIKKLNVSDAGSQTGSVSVVCGQENTAGSADGVASDATFNAPGELAVTRDGAWLIVADTGNHLMRRIRVSSQGSVPLYSTFSLGSPGAPGDADGTNPDCRFNTPSGVAIHPSGQIYVIDSVTQGQLRVISEDFATVSTIGSTGSMYAQYPRRLVFSNNFENVIISTATSDFGQRWNKLNELRISDGVKVKDVGHGARSHTDGIGSRARFNLPHSLTWTSEGALVVADERDGNVRIVDWDTDEVKTLQFPDEASRWTPTGTSYSFAYKPPPKGGGHKGGVFAGVQDSDTGLSSVKLIQFDTGASKCSACPFGLSSAAGSESVLDCTDAPPAPTTTPTPTTTSLPTSTTPPPTSTTPRPVAENETLSEQLVQTVQTTVATVVAGSVVAAVTTSVVTAAGPGAGAGSSGSGSMSTITQVQMLNQVGRMGGGRSSQGLTSASGGFGWSNYNPRNVGAAGFLGRSAPAYCSNYSDADRAGKTVSKQDQIVTTQTDDGSVPPECEFGCDWDRGAESVEQLVLCALCLVLVALARIFFSALVVHVFKRELPASMTFPMWEGPVFLTQIMGISDSLLALMTTGCLWWQVGAWALFLAGPVGFLMFACFSLYKHTGTKTLEYEPADWPSFASCRDTFREAKWYGKPYAMYDYYSGLKIRGGWSDGNAQGRHWSFLVGDFTKFAWFYCVWLMGRKICMAIIMTASEGSLNASLAVGNQFLDSIMIIIFLPYNDMQVTAVEALCGITNAMAYFSIAMPLWGLNLPGFNLPQGPQFLLASFGALVSGISSFLGSIIKLIKAFLVLKGMIQLPDNAALNVIAGTGAGGLVTGFLMDEAIGYVTSNVTSGNEPDDGEKTGASDTLDKGEMADSKNAHLQNGANGVRGVLLQPENGKATDKVDAPIFLKHWNAKSFANRAHHSPAELRTAEIEQLIITLDIDLPISTIKNDFALFKAELVHDLSFALGADRSKMHVIAVEGSSVVHLLLDKHVCGIHQTPSDVADELDHQVHDSRSLLKLGNQTRHVKKIRKSSALPEQIQHRLDLSRDKTLAPRELAMWKASWKIDEGEQRWEADEKEHEVCQECNDESTTHFCLDCGYMLCRDCAHHHSKSIATKEHRLDLVYRAREVSSTSIAQFEFAPTESFIRRTNETSDEVSKNRAFAHFLGEVPYFPIGWRDIEREVDHGLEARFMQF